MKKLVFLFVVVHSCLCYAQTSQAAFEKQINELLKYSDNDFKEIKAEPIQGAPDEFASTYKIEGAVKNVIWDIGLKYFIATFPETEDSSEAYTTLLKMEESIKKVLGNKATVKTIGAEEAPSSTTHIKNSILFRKHDGESTAYYIKLELRKIFRDGYQFAEKVKYTKWTIVITIHQDLEF